MNNLKEERALKLALGLKDGSIQGGTLYASDLDSIEVKSTTYVVALKQDSIKIDLSTTHDVLIKNVIEAYASMLEWRYSLDSTSKKLHLGLWVDAGILYVETVVLYKSIEHALRLAQDEGQRFIYELSRGTSIEVQALVDALGGIA